MNDLKVVVKKKFVVTLVEFCLDESLEFSVKPQSFPDTDWEITFKITEIKTALMAGMFLRENRIDVAGIDQQKIKKPQKKSKEEEAAEKSEDSKIQESKPEAGSLL
jgi:hypothetical protein